MGNLLEKSAAFLLVPALLTIYFPQKSEVSKEDRVIFAVWAPQKGRQPEAFILDPIVRIKGSTLTSPLPEGKEADLAWDKFEKIYFVPGKSYPLLFGASELGSITVEKAESISCESLTATAHVSKPTPLGLDGLAVSTLEGIQTHENWRHVASEQERSEFVRLASNYLRSQGAKNLALANLKIPSLRATQLRQGGPDVVIGSVSLIEKGNAHDLFLVIQIQSEKARILLASYHQSSPGEGVDRQTEKFLDQLDLDGDGTDEIITISGYYESWDYAIYREQNGEWKLVYQGGGGGC